MFRAAICCLLKQQTSLSLQVESDCYQIYHYLPSRLYKLIKLHPFIVNYKLLLISVVEHFDKHRKNT